MPIFLIVVGVLLITAAWQNSLRALFRALREDIPPFGVWAAAILFVGALGYFPVLRTPSRWLLGLIFLVIVLMNYQRAIEGFQNINATPPQRSVTPAEAYQAAQAAGGPVQATGGSAGTSPGMPAVTASVNVGPFTGTIQTALSAVSNIFRI